MKLGFSRRGQPLIVLVLLLGGWVSARAMMWDPAGVPEASPLALATMSGAISPENPGRQPRNAPDAEARQEQAGMSRPGDLFALPVAADTPPASPTPASPTIAYQDLERPFALAETAPVPAIRIAPPPRELALPPPVVTPVPPAIAAGHQLLWMAALSRIPMPAELRGMAAQSPAPQPFYPAGSEPRQGASRWSADGWLLWRRGSKLAPAGGLLTPSYGASQAGVVLRYRLAPGSALRPAAYLRATAALNGSREKEAALGLSLRPISRLPLSLHGEARFTSVPGGSMVRPAAFAVTELPPFALPLGLRGEAYGQAGYVGGKFATGFADGQLRIDHRVVSLGKAEVRLGGGTWGGIQKGASRLDAGPSLTIGHPLGGPASMRLAADWRFRVAGKAAPGSGPAVTLSAGF
jgi:hypothetical protein